MKKIIALLLAVVLLLSLTACGKTEPETPSAPESSAAKTESSAAESESAAEPQEDPLTYQFTQFGNAKIKIVGAEFFKDDWDEDMLRIYLDYTNTGDSACGQQSDALWFMSATQDGEELRRDYLAPDDECDIPEDLVYDCPTQPGCTSRQTILFPCNPDGGLIEISCYLMIGSWVFEDDKVDCFNFTIDPKNMMGVPEPLEMPAIMEPTYVAGLPTSGSIDYPIPCDVSIDGCELTKGGDGEDVLRVKLTVTNNGEEADTPLSLTDGIEAYQDGLALHWYNQWNMAEEVDGDVAYEENLEPGETVQCSALFELRNDHPVEIACESLNFETRLGTSFDIEQAVEALKLAEQAAADAATGAEKAARQALVGTWLQRDSDWEDTYTFNADGSGLLVSGPEYPFTYAISGDTLTLTYDPEDIEEFTFSLDSDVLTLIDMWDEELVLDRQAEKSPEAESEPVESSEAESEVAEEPTESEVEEENPLEVLLVGKTWCEEESGYFETFTFHADGTGIYTYTDGELYEFTYTYEVTDNEVNIEYDDGDIGYFTFRFDETGTTMYVNYDGSYEIVFTEQ